MAFVKKAARALSLLVCALVLASTLPLTAAAQPDGQERMLGPADGVIRYVPEELPSAGTDELEPVLTPAATIPTYGNPEDFPANALGFYQWLGDTEALAIFSESLPTVYGDIVQNATTIGSEDDATSLVNMKIALELIPVGNSLRTTDENFPGRSALAVDSRLMAIAQVHTNWVASYYGSNYGLAHPDAYNVYTARNADNVRYMYANGENIAGGYGGEDPFDGWYTTEKLVWEYQQEHPSASDSEVAEALGISLGMVQTGHYTNMLEDMFAATGLAYNSSIQGWMRGFHGQFFGFMAYGNSYPYADYYATFMQFFNAHQLDISGAAVTLNQSSFTYDGNAKRPLPTVTLDGTTLTRYTDYTVEYSGNTNAGTATVTITGQGNYTGTKQVTFTISPASISSATVTGIASKTYTGSAQTQSPTVKVGGQTLEEGTDYTLSYSNNVNAGSATVTITGKGNYSGSVSRTFTISPASISGATVTGITSKTYTGSAQTQSPTVKVGSRTLTSGTDYTLSYSNNVNAGTATVTITGKGNYTGSASKSFTISAAPISSATVTNVVSKTYTGFAQIQSPTVKVGGQTLTIDTDYTLSYSNNINVGTATVAINGTGNYTGSTNRVFTISPASVSDATVSLNQYSYTYDGTAKEPIATVRVGGHTLLKGTDYTLEYSDNVEVGTATVKITGKGNYTGSTSKTFTITDTPPSPMPISSCDIVLINPTYNGTARTPNPTIWDGSRILEKDADYTLSYSNNVNAGTATIIITGKGNFTGTLQATFTIKPASISDATVSAIPEQVYDGKAKTPEPTVRANGQTLRKGTDYTLSYSNNINAGTATVTVTGKGNYAGTKNATFTIAAAAEPAPQEEVAVYRMYNWRTSEHLYTTSAGEYRACGSGAYRDWVQEGVAWYAPKQGKPVYRLYNLRSGDHHYTTSAGERDSLVANHGWRYETVAFYSGGDVSILRVYNGRLKRGQHHYTTSAGERDSLVANHGWRDEGVGFRGIRVGRTESFRMVPAGAYRGTAPDTGARWTLTVRSDGSYALGISSAPGTVSEGDVVIKARYALDPGDPRNPPVVRPAGPYDFYLRRSEGQDVYMCFRYDPTTDGGCIWASHLDSGSEWKLVRS